MRRLLACCHSLSPVLMRCTLSQILFKRPEDPIVFLRDVLNHKIQQVCCALNPG